MTNFAKTYNDNLTKIVLNGSKLYNFCTKVLHCLLPPYNQIIYFSFKNKLVCISFGLLTVIQTGCGTFTPQHSTIKVFKNQLAQQALPGYDRAYIVAPTDDPLKLGNMMSSRLAARGIESTLFLNNRFFAPQGTGVFISGNGYILTCDHVLGQQDILNLQHQGRALTANVIYRDSILDLALLRVVEPGSYPAIFIAQKPLVNGYELGQDAYALGFPLTSLLGISPRLTQGIVSAKVGFGDEPSRFQISAPIQPGNSGGPIINKRGELLGLAQSTLDGTQTSEYTGGVLPQNVNFAVTAHAIVEFLETAVALDAFPANDFKAFFANSQGPAIKQEMKTVETENDFSRAETATLLISGPPISLQEAIVISIDYQSTTGQSIDNESRNDRFDDSDPLVAYFSVTLFDFRSKTPLLKLTHLSGQVSPDHLLTASLEQIRHLLIPHAYPQRTEQAKVDQSTTLAVGVSPLEPHLMPLDATNVAR